MFLPREKKNDNYKEIVVDANNQIFVRYLCLSHVYICFSTKRITEK